MPEGPCAADVAAVLQALVERFDKENGRPLLNEAEAALRWLFEVPA